MYKKFLVVASKQDKAGVNITTQLSQFRRNPFIAGISKDQASFDFYLIENSILETRHLNPDRLKEYDFIIFASKHQSEKEEKALCVHAPGNFGRADYGGEENKACRSSGLFQKFIFKKLKDYVEKYDLRGYKVTMEATHHGPLIDKPCLFIEVGATETEWKDRRAGFVLAKTIADTIDEYKENKYNEVAIGIGGPHYCPSFNKLQLNSNVAISHVIPKYAMPITEEMVREAWEKTEEDPEFAIVDWKGLGPAEERDKVIEALEALRLPWKKLSEIKR